MTVLTPQQIAQYASNAGFAGDDLVIAVAVVLGESGGNTRAVNAANTDGSADYGMWQINTIHRLTQEQSFDPVYSSSFAYKLYLGRGKRFTDWVAYTNGRYKQFLPQAQNGVRGIGQPGATPAPPQRSLGPYVIIFDRPNFGGKSQVVQSDLIDARGLLRPGDRDVPYWNAHIRSMYVPPGTVITIYENVRYNTPYNKGAKRMHATRSLPSLAMFNNGLGPSSFRYGRHGGAGDLIPQPAGSYDPISGGSYGGSSYYDGSTFSGLTARIDEISQITWTPDQDSSFRLDLGSIPDLTGGSIPIGADIQIPGSGYAKMLARNAGALAIRGLIVGAGLICISAGLKNV